MKNPYINAVCASLYITILGLGMFYGTRLLGDKPDTFFAPVTMISLFTLSAGVMFYLFVFEPLQLFIDNRKQEAVTFFLKTLGTFAFITLIFGLTLFR
ncbi:MAG: hypothetical protein AB200_02840 [Parcubacteria bacterium C7867-005]|nr:MAG: hypothetical protein AB200_02840 [Parcubacteria bacterium C7867-005]